MLECSDMVITISCHDQAWRPLVWAATKTFTIANIRCPASIASCRSTHLRICCCLQKHECACWQQLKEHMHLLSCETAHSTNCMAVCQSDWLLTWKPNCMRHWAGSDERTQ